MTNSKYFKDLTPLVKTQLRVISHEKLDHKNMSQRVKVLDKLNKINSPFMRERVNTLEAMPLYDPHIQVLKNKTFGNRVAMLGGWRRPAHHPKYHGMYNVIANFLEDIEKIPDNKLKREVIKEIKRNKTKTEIDIKKIASSNEKLQT